LSDEVVVGDDGQAFAARPASQPPSRLHPRLSDAELLDEIGRALRSVYSELLREPIPEHLATIIERLETRSLKPH
jgi:Anti-sigma factor NepR